MSLMEGTGSPVSSTRRFRGAPASVVRQVGKVIKPPAPLHPPHLLLEGGKAIGKEDEVGEEHDLQWQFSLETIAVREVADHARIRPARQGG
eukprot:4589880-Pleurochrysis_carterae.AAC.1